MYWGFKSRFHDLDDVMKFNPKMVEFHLTDEDVEKGGLNSKIYNCDYSIHLPEYWHGVMIDPCNLDNLPHNLSVYQACIEKGLSLKNRFNVPEIWRMKVIMHPGGATVDPITDEIHPIWFYKDSLYKRLASFLAYIEMIPQFKDKIEILVENMPPLPWFYGGQYYSNIFCDPIEIKHFCKTRNRKICLDISHLGLYCNYVNKEILSKNIFLDKDELYDLIDSIKLLKPYVAQIHIADADGTDGEGAPMGEGNVDFEAVTKELKDLDCAYIPETMWGHKDNYEEFTKIIKECDQWLI